MAPSAGCANEDIRRYVAQTRHVAFETVRAVSLDAAMVGWALVEW